MNRSQWNAWILWYHRRGVLRSLQGWYLVAASHAITAALMCALIPGDEARAACLAAVARLRCKDAKDDDAARWMHLLQRRMSKIRGHR